MDEKTAPILLPPLLTALCIMLMSWFVTDGWSFWPRVLATVPAVIAGITIGRWAAAKCWPVST